MSASAPPPATIAAIATPPGRGGVGIVRVSGTAIESLIEAAIGHIPAPRVATYCTFRDANDAPLDNGLALLFPAPHSYTGETVLELHAHGSPAGLRLLLARCLELGARLAAPGEFTQRAFLNGKVDLAQAESVADLIEAASATAARAAARSLNGEFSREVNALVDEVTTLRMYTEATLDFPEEDVDFLRSGQIPERVGEVRSELDALLARARTGALLREGLVIVLVGRPNVGKSSLLNQLVREEAAIVTPVPGTTRDTIERRVEIAGIPVTMVDTAGLRDTIDEVEQQGIARTIAALERADVVLVIVDARTPPDALDLEDAALLTRMPDSVPQIVVHNKTDLACIAPRLERRVSETGARTHVFLSALTGAGIDLLEDAVQGVLGVAPVTEDAFLARARHVEALRDAQGHLTQAATQLAVAPPPLELFAEELRQAQRALSAITGEFTADDLLGVIFSRFCIGK
jgi:tRNA modification GTPase